jgi:hypothetical protein
MLGDNLPTIIGNLSPIAIFFLSSPVTEKLGSKFLESKNSILKSFLHQETSKPKSLRSSQLQNTKKSPKN